MKRWRWTTDALILLGATIILIGIWRIFPPLAMVIGGAMVIVLAFIWDTR